jgi:hypothetical protein
LSVQVKSSFQKGYKKPAAHSEAAGFFMSFDEARSAGFALLPAREFGLQDNCAFMVLAT